MSQLTDALEGLRQAKKQLQWVTFAESALKELEQVQNERNRFVLEATQAKEELHALAAQKATLEKDIEHLTAKSHEASKNEHVAVQRKEQAEAEALAALDKANAAAKSLHDDFVNGLNNTLSEAQDRHDEFIAKLNEEINLLIEKKEAILADIEELSKKWSH